MKTLPRLLLAASVLAATAFQARAYVADFEAPTYTTTGGTGYLDGNLGGQNNWNGSSGTTGLDYLRVTANPLTVGDTSAQALTLFDTGVTTGQLYRTFGPSLGTGNTFSSTSSTLAYSLSFLYSGTSFATTTGALARFGIGAMGSGFNVNQIEFDSNGVLKYSYGSTATSTSALSLGQWYTLSGTVDYSTDTWTLYINGVQQGGTLSFLTGATTAQSGGTTLTDDLNIKAMGATGASYTGMVFDNLSLTAVAVPEPSEWALMGLGLSLCAVAGLRRARRLAVGVS
ncbi:MAG TPA: LamG-like jellyroll fold domain-containing protein [Candidatus Methylacidiphilales bacterium]